MSFYAVAKGRAPGIYKTWPECQQQVNGFSNAAFKKFKTEEQARAYIGSFEQRTKETLKRKAETQDVDESEYIEVYSDGNCLNNGKPGAVAGSGVYLQRNGKPETWSARTPGAQTNGRAELFALALALLATINDDKIVVRPDAQYIVNGVTDPTWLAEWKVNGWRRSNKEPVKNQDLWKLVDAMLMERERRGLAKPHWEWVKAHGDSAANEAADKAATNGMTKPYDWPESIAIFPVEYDIELSANKLTRVKKGSKFVTSGV